MCCGRDTQVGVPKLREIFGRFAREHATGLTRGDSVNAQEFRALLAALVRLCVCVAAPALIRACGAW